MKRAGYVYKVKRGRNNSYLKILEELGFRPYIADGDDESETIYAIHIRLKPETSGIYQNCINNFCKVYEMCNEKEREDFDEYDFYEVRNADTGKITVGVNLTEKQKDDFIFCQLCFAVNGFNKYTLFINAPDKVEYYGTEVLDNEIGNFINEMKKLGIIYKKKYEGE